MAKPGPLPLSIGNLLEEARKRWLKSTEVCEILMSYKTYKFRLSEEPPVRPPAGSLFLFDRKHCRFFRKDGHNWRKKKDGKAVRETHEKLKVGAVELLNCYYAHAEHSDSFQRRSYWLLGEKDEGIVLVHYLNVRESQRSREFPEAKEEDQFFRPTQSTAVLSEPAVPSEHTALAHNTNLTYALEPPCSASSQATSSPAAYPLIFEPRIAPETAAAQGSEYLGGPSFQPRKYPSNASLQAWAQHSSHFSGPTEVKPSIPQEGQVLLQHTVAPMQRPYQEPENSVPASVGRKGCVDAIQARLTDLERTFMQAGGSSPFAETMQAERFQATIQELTDDVNQLELAAGLPPPDEAVDAGSASLVGAEWGVLPEQRPGGDVHDNSLLLGLSSDLDMRFTTDLSESGTEAEPESLTGPSALPGVAVGGDAPQDCGVIGVQPGLGLDGELELVIADFAPEWDTEVGGAKVLLFCKGMTSGVTDQCVCVFGSLRVPVVQLQPGVLRCYAPSHPPGRVPLYLCQREDNQPSSNVCEFWYRAQRQGNTQVGVSLSEPKQAENDRQFYIRLVTMLTQSKSSGGEMPAEVHAMSTSTLRRTFHVQLQKALRGFIQRISTACRLERRRMVAQQQHLNALDAEGLTVLHLVSAVGLAWAVRLLVQCGASVDSLDTEGATALHWAAKHGQEEVVSALLALGASPTKRVENHCSPVCGYTPADIAAENGHQGIAAYLEVAGIDSRIPRSRWTEDATETGAEQQSASGSSPQESHRAILRKWQETVARLDSKPPKSTSSSAPILMASTRKRPHQSDSDGTCLSDIEGIREFGAVHAASGAAVTIQTAFRDFQERRQEKQEREEAATVIQEAFRSQRAALRQNHQEKVSAVMVIQGAFRTYQERQSYLDLRDRIVRLQSHIRARQQRRQYSKLKRWVVHLQDTVRSNLEVKQSRRNRFRRQRSVSGDAPSHGHHQEVDDHDDDTMDGLDEDWPAIARTHHVKQHHIRQIEGSATGSLGQGSEFDAKLVGAQSVDEKTNEKMEQEQDVLLLQAVTRVQAIVRSQKAQDQYQRLRATAMMLQHKSRNRSKRVKSGTKKARHGASGPSSSSEKAARSSSDNSQGSGHTNGKLTRGSAEEYSGKQMETMPVDISEQIWQSCEPFGQSHLVQDAPSPSKLIGDFFDLDRYGIEEQPDFVPVTSWQFSEQNCAPTIADIFQNA